MHDFRSYLAGLGSSGALIAAALVAFLTLGGLVAIKGLPESSEPAAGRILVETEAAAVTAGAVTGGDRAQRPPSDRQDRRDGGSDSGRGDDDSPTPGGGGAIPEPVAPVPGPADPPGLTPPPTNPGTQAPPEPEPEPEPDPEPDPQPPSPSQGPQPPGAIGGLVDDVDQVVDDTIGFNPGVGHSIRPVTDPVDQVIGGLGLPPGAIPQLPGLPRSGS